MSWMIEVSDIPSEGLAVSQDVLGSDVGLPAEDGRIRGLLQCTGQLSISDEQIARFEGTLQGRIVRECVRCLVEFEEAVACPCEVTFSRSSYPVPSPASSKKSKRGSRAKHMTHEEHEDEIDAYPIVDQKIDLMPGLREHLILAAPLNPLCREECAGLCQVCGANLNESACACYAPVTASPICGAEGASLLGRDGSRPFAKSVTRGV